jgi:DNA-directed RNA polymerase II subunit RPB3
MQDEGSTLSAINDTKGSGADFAAIDQVSFLQNTTPVPDEMLAHRLGLVPLVSRGVTDGLRYTRVSLRPFFPS